MTKGGDVAKKRSPEETARYKEDVRIVRHGTDSDFNSIEQRIRNYRFQEAQANELADKAMTAVQKENRRLRALLEHMGMDQGCVDSALQHGGLSGPQSQPQPAAVWQSTKRDSASEKVLALQYALSKKPTVFLDIPNPKGRVTFEEGKKMYWSDPNFTKGERDKMQANGIDPVAAGVLRSLGQYKEGSEKTTTYSGSSAA
ncbi:hypothetical protein BGZ63DRAFT_421351 [Mariannaea sp. PMI_226]|nr:hypothetical protein BGZ63DRAFT_421351 [Mariannaea sp. PMI_226]